MTPALVKNLGDRGFSSVANCTDKQVHQSSLDAKKAQEQARRSKIYVQNQKKIMDCMKKLEELALELLKYGLKTDEEITDYVASGIEEGAKYKAAVLYRMEKARLNVLKTEAQFTADMGLAQVKAGGEIELISARYGIEVGFLQQGFKVQAGSFRSQLQASADAKNQEAVARQQQEAYWRGESTSVGGKKSLGGGGLFQSISKSVSSWFKI
ncbi:hypothetical protein [Microcoleus sp. Pol12B5]|uniref:hypothetical protein n=1 Tax=Microcoleus sp. Pol12B5 TaxID=3055396 RepID=UPI002FD20CB4